MALEGGASATDNSNEASRSRRFMQATGRGGRRYDTLIDLTGTRCDVSVVTHDSGMSSQLPDKSDCR